jgi:hypothetical protein
MQILLQPYLFSILNTMELVSLTVTSLTLYLAAFFTVQEPQKYLHLVILSFVLIVGNVAAMLWFLWMIMSAGVTTVLKQVGAMDNDEHQVPH